MKCKSNDDSLSEFHTEISLCWQTYVNSTTHQVLPPGEFKSEFNVGQIELEKDMI